MTWTFHSDFQSWSGAHRLFITHTDHFGHTAVVQPLTLKVIEPGAPYDEPTMSEGILGTLGGGEVTGFLQAALDLAWSRGLRPKGHVDAGGELSAVRFHLEDMRKLALKDRA